MKYNLHFLGKIKQLSCSRSFVLTSFKTTQVKVWENKKDVGTQAPLASVSTAYSSCPKLSRAPLFG